MFIEVYKVYIIILLYIGISLFESNEFVDARSSRSRIICIYNEQRYVNVTNLYKNNINEIHNLKRLFFLEQIRFILKCIIIKKNFNLS
jgi:hypothetical protein